MQVWIEAGEYMTIDDAAAELKVSRATIRRLIERQELATITLHCRCNIIAVKEVNRYRNIHARGGN